MAIEPIPTSAAPVRKVAAAGLGGAATTLILYIAKHYAGIELPADVAGAVTTIVTFGLAYFVPSAPAETL